MKKIFLAVMALMLLVTFASESAEARRRKKSRGSSKKVSRSYYPSKKDNRDFLNSCSSSVPTVYNPNIGGSMEGGGKNRLGEKINSIEDAAKNGRPVTVAMDRFGAFGAQCNNKSRNGSSKRCLLLVQLPGLDKQYPAYGKKFPNLPADSFIAMVEDTGGAFSYKGTGKMDVPFRSGGLYRASPFRDLKFEILQAGVTNGGEVRKRDMTHLSPFINDRSPKCSWDASRRTKNAPVVVNSNKNLGAI